MKMKDYTELVFILDRSGSMGRTGERHHWRIQFRATQEQGAGGRCHCLDGPF